MSISIQVARSEASQVMRNDLEEAYSAFVVLEQFDLFDSVAWAAADRSDEDEVDAVRRCESTRAVIA